MPSTDSDFLHHLVFFPLAFGADLSLNVVHGEMVGIELGGEGGLNDNELVWGLVNDWLKSSQLIGWIPVALQLEFEDVVRMGKEKDLRYDIQCYMYRHVPLLSKQLMKEALCATKGMLLFSIEESKCFVHNNRFINPLRTFS